MKKTILISFLAFLLVVGIASAITMNVDELKTLLYQNEQGNEKQEMLGNSSLIFRATTTPENATNADSLLHTGYGVFGSVIITTAGNTAFDILNATTTDIINGNSVRKATSSILMASFPASASVGNYDFNAAFSDGLYFDVKSGSLGTSTITWF